MEVILRVGSLRRRNYESGRITRRPLCRRNSPRTVPLPAKCALAFDDKLYAVSSPNIEMATCSQVVEVGNGDWLTVSTPTGEKKVFLSSIRAPKYASAPLPHAYMDQSSDLLLLYFRVFCISCILLIIFVYVLSCRYWL